MRTCEDCARDPKDVTLLAVSKTHAPDQIRALYEHRGVIDFAENYQQELATKMTSLRDIARLRWHFIGQLQANKIKKLHDDSVRIHTFSKLEHIDRLAKLSASAVSVGLLINAGDESQKAGITIDHLDSFIAELQARYGERVRITQLMAVPPEHLSHSPKVPPLYLSLKALADRFSQGQLSLGMSADMKIAIQSGSTCIRIGTSIFGPRS